MKAAVFKGVGQPLVIETLPDPTPGPGEVVLKVGRCGICGTDLGMTDGHADTFPVGSVIGHEFSGEVVAVGPKTEGFKLGDHVAAMPTTGCGECATCLAGEPWWCDRFAGLLGGYGQYAVAKTHAAVRLPNTLTVEDGALIEPLAVSLHGVALARLAPGARVLIIGAGPIGLGAAFWARQLGAGRIAVMARSNRAAAMAEQMGASAFVTQSDDLTQKVSAALGGPPDVVFECAGVPGTIARAIEQVKKRGRVVSLGACMAPDTFVPALALYKEVDLQFSMVYSVREFEEVARVLDAGRVEPRAMITDRVGLSELPPVFEALRQKTHQCKVMIDPWNV